MLLALPITSKILIANTAIVVSGAIGGTWFTLAIARGLRDADYYGLVALFAGLGALVSVIVNYLVLRAAFAPLRSLEATVTAVRNGDVLARAPHLATSDPAIDKLRETLNGMLDALAGYRGQLRATSSKIITAQEEERRRISRELHDETAQALTSLLIRLRLVQNARTLEEAHREIAELRELTVQTIEEVRKLAIELRPTTLDNLGLVAAIEWYCRDYRERIGATIAFDVHGTPRRVHPEIELVVYRVAQEALTNIARHAGASEASVVLAFSDDSLEMRIRDNGIGFDPSSIDEREERGLGLFGMRERVELVGGSFSIRGGPGIGTVLVMRVPSIVWGDRRLGLDSVPTAIG